MANRKLLTIGIGIASAGGMALLLAHSGAFTAKPEPFFSAEVRTAALPGPISLGAGEIPFVAVIQGAGTTASSYAWTLVDTLGPGGGTAAATGHAQTANQFGPYTYNVGNLKAISFSVTPNPANPAGTDPVLHASDTTPWVVGAAGVGQSTGTAAATLDNTFGSGNGGIADGYLTLQTANNLGPAFFNLNVLKSLSFTQPPNGLVLANGQTDDFRAVDIGRWEAGIPGVITNTGTTGFLVDRGYGVGLGTYEGLWGLHTTTQIGSQTFDYNFLPAISFPSMTFTPFGQLAPGAPPEIDVPITSPVAGSPAQVTNAPFDPGAGAPTVPPTPLAATGRSAAAPAATPPAAAPAPVVEGPIPVIEGSTGSGTSTTRTSSTGGQAPRTGFPDIPGVIRSIVTGNGTGSTPGFGFPGIPGFSHPTTGTGSGSSTGAGSGSSTGTGTGAGTGSSGGSGGGSGSGSGS